MIGDLRGMGASRRGMWLPVFSVDFVHGLAFPFSTFRSVLQDAEIQMASLSATVKYRRLLLSLVLHQ